MAFDNRSVKFYDGNKAYTIEFSIASLQDGKKIAYAKKFYGFDAILTKKIQIAEAMSKQSQLNQQPVSDNSISQNFEKSSGEAKKFFNDENEVVKQSDEGKMEAGQNKSSLSYENEADANADKRLNNVDDMLPVREDVNVQDTGIMPPVREDAQTANVSEAAGLGSLWRGVLSSACIFKSDGVN